jgi:long-chain acyl-CoA synthetase
MVKNVSSVSDFLKALASTFGDQSALHGRVLDQWTTTSYRDLQELAEKGAQALRRRGLRPDDKVILMAKSKPLYGIGFFALSLNGIVTVPLDIRLSLADQNYILDLVEAKAIVCFRDETLSLARALVAAHPKLEEIFVLEDLLEEESNEAQGLLPDLKRDQLAVIAFTSGTVSRPKGVMLSWGHFLFQMQAIEKIFPDDEGKRMLSVLPLHHMFEFTTGLLAPLSRGGEIFYADSFIPHQILSFLHEKEIADMMVVPLFLKSLKKGIESEINRSKLKQIWFATVNRLARIVPWRGFRRLLFYPIHRKLGGNLQRFLSGASSLDPKVQGFFERMGVDIFEGYGLTETSPIVATNSPRACRRGTVGLALPGVEVKKDQNTGELLVRGPNVMWGYYRNLQCTQDCVSADGWFNTGDVVEIDQDGFIKIVGRTKDLIVLGSGKKVVPDEVEEYFQDYELLQEICVVGMTSQKGMTKGTDIVTAVIFPHQERIRERALSPEDAKAEILMSLKALSQKMSYYKRPSDFVLVSEALPKTSTQKVKRTLVREMLTQMLKEEK